MDTCVLNQPENAEGSGGTGSAHPAFLVVLCHGLESEASQLALLPHAWEPLFPGAIFFLPDAPEICRRRVVFSRGRQWWSLKLSPEHQMAAAAGAAAALNQRVDGELARLALPAGAVVFCGFSQGAMVALLAGLARDVAPLGIVSMAGGLEAPEQGFEPRCRPPVLLVHGQADERVAPSRSEHAARLLRALEIDARLVILPRLGHWVVPEAAPVAAGFMREVCR